MLNKLSNIVFKIFIELFIVNRKKRSKIKARHAKKYLKKYVDNAALIQNIHPPENTTGNNIIWQYWHDSETNAPKLIQKCFESVRRNMPAGYKQVIVTFDTIKDYVELPQKYYDLIKKKKVPIAILSDILRVYLLNKYGGTWIDATIFLTDKIPDDIMNSDFFVFQKKPKRDLQENKMSCFFIHTKSYGEQISALKHVLDAYWEENDFVVNYFMFEHISTMLSDKTEALKKEWDSMPYYYVKATRLLSKNLFKEFTQEGWERLKQKTSIHKLSYKNIPLTTNGSSYYDYLLNSQAV